MNLLFQSLYAHFSNTTGSGFYYDISGRMYHNAAPQGAAFPYCIYFLVDNIDELDFSDEREDLTMQFNIFSQNSSALEAGNLLDSLETMFDNCRLTVTGWNHLEFKRNMVHSNNDFTQDPPIQGYSIEYDVLLERQRN